MVSPMDNNNNKGRSRLFGCFNSPTNEGTDQSGFDSMPPPLSDDEILRRKRTTLRNLSGSLKSIIFKSTLVKKLKSKRPSRREFYYRSISSLSSKLKKPVKKLQPASKGYSEMEDIADDSDHYSLFSPTSSASSCASSVSSVASESAKISDSSLDLPLVVSGMSYGRRNAIKKADGGMKFKYSAAATGMCMFLVCLVALVFWGKAIAIVTCTSAWLFWAANYHRSHRSMGGEVAVKEVAVSNAVLDSEEDKKRVIMEGLLERTHPRFIHP